MAQALGALAAMVGGGNAESEGSGVLTGEVTAVGTGMLRVFAGGLPLTEKDLLLSAALKAGYATGLAGTLVGTATTPDGGGGTLTGTVTVPVTPGQLTEGVGLTVGDRVVLFTPDRQIYYILCKVVRP